MRKTSPKDFAAKLGDLDVPEGLREAHNAALSRLSSANEYAEPKAPAPEPKQRGPAQASAFLPGVAVRPAAVQPTPYGSSGHGVTNPVAAEAAAKPVGVER
ncbi:hypothetical protein [Streptomyces sp. NBC_01244]|uniref:hypothetical protein n=1 Tax=Streptomyces sp. NBC_01244 TaxID=2903797 RepID=UPI002E126324|nr:hypothetical protein OG247_24280 [Streptomyces sp. NBC_01244]